MGVINEQMVICTTYDWDSNDRSDLDEFVEAHTELFVKSPTFINGVINYVMFWDGSKEGWDISDEGDKLRKKFISLIKKLDWATIYEINNFERESPLLTHTFIMNGEVYVEDS